MGEPREIPNITHLIRRKDGTFVAKHNGRLIDKVVAFSVAASEQGAICTLVFHTDVVDIMADLDKIFIGREVSALESMPEEKLQEV